MGNNPQWSLDLDHVRALLAQHEPCYPTTLPIDIYLVKIVQISCYYCSTVGAYQAQHRAGESFCNQ